MSETTYQKYDKKEQHTTIGMPKDEGPSSEATTMTIGDYTCKKAPSVTENVYEEAMPMLFASEMAYTLTELLNKKNKNKITLLIPEEYEDWFGPNFLKESIDFTDDDKTKNGISFDVILELLKHNEEEIERSFSDEQSYERKVVDWFKENTDIAKKCFLTHHRYISQDHACVYSIYKDTHNKRIIVSFRGSVGVFSTRDWATNVKVGPTKMWTPSLIADKMEGEFKENMLVHEGFYEYIFDNHQKKGDQRYDEIIRDIKKVIEEGYSVYVTGHSLGGALATMFSMKIAGCGKKHGKERKQGEEGEEGKQGEEKDNRAWLPRPITCITVAAPMSGTASYRTAVELLEKHGLLRSLRINYCQDIVPAIPPVSFCPIKRMMHVGMNLRLERSGYRIEHSSRANTWTVLRNNMFKLICCLPKWHGLLLHDASMNENKEELEREHTLDDLYKNKEYVSKNFIDGNLS